jgi:hypothetical protein
MKNVDQWRGFAALLTDSVDGGSRAVERIQKETAERVFAALEIVPAMAPTVRLVQSTYFFFVGGAHRAVRLVNGGLRNVLDVGLRSMDRSR